MVTYTIEKAGKDGQWSAEGLGDSRGYRSLEDAECAVQSLENLGPEWAGTYRIILDGEDVQNLPMRERVVSIVTLGAASVG